MAGTAEGPIRYGYRLPLPLRLLDRRVVSKRAFSTTLNLEIMMKAKTFFLVVVAGGFGIAAILTLLGLA